eukprot:7379379-Prymnesium_polylepis.1
MALVTDAAFRPDTERYAADSGAFFADFSAAYSKLSELGWSDGRLTAVSYTLPGVEDGNTTSATKGEMQLKQGLMLKWVVQADGNVSATLELAALVQWMALGVSHSGRMISPQPSYAVVGTDAA